MAQQTRFARRTETRKTANTIDACGAIETCRCLTIVNVHTTIGAGPAVHAYTRIAALCVCACGTILAHRRTQRTFVNIIFTIFAGPIGRALATV